MEVLINGQHNIMINHDRWVLYQCGSTADHKPDTNDTARGMIQRKRVVEHCKYIVTDHNDSWWQWRWYGDYLEAAELMYTKPKQKKYDQTLLFCWWWVSTVCFPRKMTHNQLCKFQLVLMQISNFEKKVCSPTGHVYNWEFCAVLSFHTLISCNICRRSPWTLFPWTFYRPFNTKAPVIGWLCEEAA